MGSKIEQLIDEIEEYIAGCKYQAFSNSKIIEQANLKQTSLVTLARQAGIEPEAFIRHFIETEREERAHGHE